MNDHVPLNLDLPSAHTQVGAIVAAAQLRAVHVEVLQHVGLAVDPDQRKSISEVIRKDFTRPKDSGETEGQITGILRAVHLDQDWLEITVDGKHERVYGVGETVDDVVGPLMNRRVIVQITTQAGRQLFRDIDAAP